MTEGNIKRQMDKSYVSKYQIFSNLAVSKGTKTYAFSMDNTANECPAYNLYKIYVYYPVSISMKIRF